MPANTSLVFDTVGDLEVNAFINGPGSAGVVKNSAGVLNINRVVVNGFATTVNAGQLTLNSGRDNTLYVTVAATVPTYYGIVSNGGTLELNGNSQDVASLTSIDPLPGLAAPSPTRVRRPTCKFRAPPAPPSEAPSRMAMPPSMRTR